MKRKCLAHNDCPLARAYNAIGDWWSLLIITRIVLLGDRRFCSIQQSLGMARNILTARLKKLVEHGILIKAPASDGSAYHDYLPTEKGRDLYITIIALRQWGERHFPAAACTTLLDTRHAQPLPNITVRDATGRALAASEIQISPATPRGVEEIMERDQ